MKSLFLLTLLSISIVSVSFAGNYRPNEQRVDALFESSIDISETYQSIMHGNYNLNADQSVAYIE